MRAKVRKSSKVIDTRRRTTTSMAAAKEKTAMELDSWKYERYFQSQRLVGQHEQEIIQPYLELQKFALK